MLGGAAPGVLKKRSFSLSGHRTSIALEPEFWRVLEDMAAGKGTTLAALVARIDTGRAPAKKLASALRVAALCATQDAFPTKPPP